MSKFKAGDRVRHKREHSDTATILAVHEDHYWVKYDGEPWRPITVSVTYIGRDFELAPEGELS